MFKKIAIAAVVAIVASTEGAEAVKIEQKATTGQAVENYINAESGSKAEWGFLKNIVNIDRFFDSGVKAWAILSNENANLNRDQ